MILSEYEYKPEYINIISTNIISPPLMSRIAVTYFERLAINYSIFFSSFLTMELVRWMCRFEVACRLSLCILGNQRSQVAHSCSSLRSCTCIRVMFNPDPTARRNKKKYFFFMFLSPTSLLWRARTFFLRNTFSHTSQWNDTGSPTLWTLVMCS